jgi:peroxiredoxin
VRLEVSSRTNGELDTFNSYDVLEMKQVAPNLWVPVHVLFWHGKEIVVKDITVNERLPDDLFTIKFPDGTRVQDDRRDRSYTVVDVPTPAEPRQKAEIGGPAPELVLEQGAAVKLAQFKGMPVVLAFVSIYARPCVKVLDDLKALQEKEGADKLGVIAVHDRTATPEEIEQFRKDHSIPFPIVRVPAAPRDGWDSETFRAYGVTALPTVVRIDTEGKVESVGAGLP